MRKILAILFVLSSFLSYSQNLKSNSIGVVRFEKIENENLYLNIYFPTSCLDSIPSAIKKNPYSLFNDTSNFTIPFSGNILIADENRRLYEFDDLNYIRFVPWCENDGGINLMLQIPAKIKKDKLSYDYKLLGEVERFICFATFNFSNPQKSKPEYIDKVECLKKVDFDNDGIFDAFIHGIPDEAMGGYCLYLGYGKLKNVSIDCCGP